MISVRPISEGRRQCMACQKHAVGEIYVEAGSAATFVMTLCREHMLLASRRMSSFVQYIDKLPKTG